MATKQSFWFWAWIVLGTIRKDNLHNPKARCEIWENLVIIRGTNPKEAFHKAEKLGKQSSGDSRGTLRLFGKPARQMFLGIQNIGVIHEPLKDGAEITWNLKRLALAKARKLARPKTRLLRELSREFSYVARN
jgi:hypothetical protein